MGDTGDDFREHRKQNKLRKAKNLVEFNADGWTKHTRYHYSKIEGNIRIDYYPSTKRLIKTKIKNKRIG